MVRSSNVAKQQLVKMQTARCINRLCRSINHRNVRSIERENVQEARAKRIRADERIDRFQIVFRRTFGDVEMPESVRKLSCETDKFGENISTRHPRLQKAERIEGNKEQRTLALCRADKRSNDSAQNAAEESRDETKSKLLFSRPRRLYLIRLWRVVVCCSQPSPVRFAFSFRSFASAVIATAYAFRQ